MSGRRSISESGERPLSDFEPVLYKRERAADLLSESLGWGFSPRPFLPCGPSCSTTTRYPPCSTASSACCSADRCRWTAPAYATRGRLYRTLPSALFASGRPYVGMTSPITEG